MRAATVIPMSVQQMVCTACGSEANASCNCGKPYVPKKQRAADALKENPRKSNVAIAKEIGVSDETVRQVRQQLGSNYLEPEREGRDGKIYRLPARDEEPDDDDSGHEEGLRIIAVRGFLNRASEAKQIATIGKLQARDVTNEMIKAADDAAAAWTAASQTLRGMIQ